MSVFTKIPAFEFELNFYSLPPVRSNLTFTLTIRKSSLDSLNRISKFPGDHPKQEHDAQLIYRCMSEAAKISCPQGSCAISRGLAVFIRPLLRHRQQ